MRIDYEPTLIEQAVFHAARRNPQLEARLHRATDRLYDLTEPEEKDSRFREVHKNIFQDLRLDEVIPRLLAEPRCTPSSGYAGKRRTSGLIERHVGHCIVREAASTKKEAADLYVNSDRNTPDSCTRTLFIQVCPQSLLNPEPFERRMRRELLHVADMLDERYGYDKDSLAGHQPRQNLIRDRYRVLWDIYVEGRLSRQGDGDQHAKRSLSHQFERVFAKYSACLFPPSFERIFLADGLTHRQLMQWACAPELLFEQNSASVASGVRRDAGRYGLSPAPGEPCPICKFSTYDWFNSDDLSPELIAAVQKDFPQWLSPTGICRQCTEIYGSIVGQ